MKLLNKSCLGFSFLIWSITSQYAHAQPIQTDKTTPTRPVICVSSCIISGGVLHGNNLFHSFSRFNVDSGQTVLFDDPGVTNILSRVTGSDKSNIFGTLGVTGGNANLFLLNQRGILFGPDSSLSLGGSFIATTANAIKFGNQGLLDSSKSKIPALTVNPSALVFYDKTGSIVSKSRKPIGLDLSKSQVYGLKVPDGKSLLFIGGDITIDGNERRNNNGENENGGLNAFGGRVELAGLSEAGTIGLSNIDNRLGLEFPGKGIRSNVSIINGAKINTTASGSGDIIIWANNLSILNRSEIRAGIARKLGSLNSQAGDIKIYANGRVTLNNSFLFNIVRNDAIGNGGNIYIISDEILLNSGNITAAVAGKGNSGNISLKARSNVFLLDLSGIFNRVNPSAIGNGGDISIRSNNIYLQDFSQIANFAFGIGKPGDVSLIASENISLKSDSRAGSSIVAKDIRNISSAAVLQDILTPSKVSIQTKSLSLTGGSQIANFATGNGVGVGGDIVIRASDSINISGFSQGTDLSNQKIFNGLDADNQIIKIRLPNGAGFSSGFFAFARDTTTGPAGNITVETNNFSISDGAAISTQTFNSSDGGDITITAKKFSALSGAQIRTTASSQGDAGNIKLQVTGNITLSGSDPNFEKRLLTLRSGLLAIELLSTVRNAQQAEQAAQQADREIQLLREIGPNSGLFASTTRNSTGTGGTIFVDPQLVLIQNGAGIAVNSQGSGPGGNINLISDKLQLSNQAFITATSLSNQGGDITLTLDDFLFMRDGSRISASAGSPGNPGDGGNINIIADYIVAEPNTNSDITADSFSGKGGSINITPRRGFFGFVTRKQEDLNGATPEELDTNDISAISRSGGPNLNGQVNINNPEVDPSDNLSEQPEVVEPPQEIAKGCRPGQSLGGSTFTHVGRGGLPTTPYETQTPTTVWQDLRSHNLQPTSTTSTEPSPSSLIPTPTPDITEAKGWVKDSQGRIYLTANVPQPTQTPQPTVTC